MADSLTGRRKKRSLADIKSRIDSGLKVTGEEGTRLIKVRRGFMGDPSEPTPISDIARTRYKKLILSKKKKFGEWSGAREYLYGPKK